MIKADYITETQKIYSEYRNRKTRREKLEELYADSETIFKKHLPSERIMMRDMIDYLLDPGTVRRIGKFSAREWLKTGHQIAKKLKKQISEIPEPTIVFYPGMRGVNGKVIWLGKNPVMSLSPDFGYFTGNNLTVLLAHEYTHYLRARFVGVKYRNMPLYQMIFEEGLAIHLSRLLIPDIPMSAIFMSNLHYTIGMPDPKGGYVRWCKRMLPDLANAALESLSSKEPEPRAQFFEGGTFTGIDDSPIRTGYYLGHRALLEAAKDYDLEELLRMKPTAKMMRGYLKRLAG